MGSVRSASAVEKVFRCAHALLKSGRRNTKHLQFPLFTVIVVQTGSQSSANRPLPSSGFRWQGWGGFVLERATASLTLTG